MTMKMRGMSSGILLAFLLATTITLIAQTAPDAAAGAAAAGAAAAEQPAREPMTLWSLWTVGGFIMYPLGLCSVLTIALVVYGFINTQEKKMLQPDLIPPIQEALDKLNIEEAQTICNGTPCLLTNILNAGLRRISDGILDVPSMEKAMEEASVEETAEGLKPINNLSVVAQVAPMLGLLGTVVGMIQAFNKIGLGAMGDPEKLADDIGKAMVTTAFGLIVAIPAMFGYFWLKAQYMSNVSRLSRILGNLTHHLVATTRRAASGADAAAGAPTEA